MPGRIDHLIDTQTRLLGKTAALVSVHRSRSLNTEDDDLPAILLYAPDEVGEPFAAGHPQFNVSMTIAIEVRVRSLSDWDTVAATLMAEIKAVLFTDPDWTRRWRKPPRYRIRQYIEDKHDRMLCGEVMTLDVELINTDEFQPVVQPTMATVVIDVDGLAADPDGAPDVTVTAVSIP